MKNKRLEHITHARLGGFQAACFHRTNWWRPNRQDDSNGRIDGFPSRQGTTKQWIGGFQSNPNRRWSRVESVSIGTGTGEGPEKQGRPYLCSYGRPVSCFCMRGEKLKLMVHRWCWAYLHSGGVLHKTKIIEIYVFSANPPCNHVPIEIEQALPTGCPVRYFAHGQPNRSARGPLVIGFACVPGLFEQALHHILPMPVLADETLDAVSSIVY